MPTYPHIEHYCAELNDFILFGSSDTTKRALAQPSRTASPDITPTPEDNPHAKT